MPGPAVDHEHGVTPRELFFDLVFVFAFTQVATLREGTDPHRARYVVRRSHCSRVISYSTSPSPMPSTGSVREVGKVRT
jgi:hypothetical protein